MGKLIFFVDDDKMILNLLEYTFQSRKNYNVKTFLSGEDCLKNLSLDPDLIVLDHVLSGSKEGQMDGMDTMKMINQQNPDIPVIILTGYGDDELLAEFMASGATRFLTKDDYFIDSLIDAIGQILKE